MLSNSQENNIRTHPNYSVKLEDNMEQKPSRAMQLILAAKKRKEEEALSIDDALEDYAEEVIEGKKQIKTAAASVTNKDILPATQAKTYSAALEQAIELLGKKVPAAHVCTATGLSPSYLHEMMQDEMFMGRIVSIQTTKLHKATVRDESYNRIEDKLLERLEAQIPGLVDPEKTAKVLKIVNSAVRRGSGEVNGGETHVTNNVVQLTMPDHLLKMFQNQNSEIVLNENKEVVQVGNTQLGRMDSTKLLGAIEAEKRNNVEFIDDTEDDVSNLTQEELRSIL